MNELTLHYQGSVKNLYSAPNTNDLFFEFTDDYSIFDWGKMPDAIPGKGQALLSMAENFFKLWSSPSTWKEFRQSYGVSDLSVLEIKILQDFCYKGVPSHFLRKVQREDRSLLQVKKMKMTFPMLRHEGEHKLWIYPDRSETWVDEFIPLEVIFRLGAPKGSSLLKRTWSMEQWSKWGLSNAPVEGERFHDVVVEFSTKLEDSDRILSDVIAQEISSLTSEDLQLLKATTSLLARQLEYFFASLGIELWDGKFEFGATKKPGENIKFVLVDALGPDELRLTYQGAPLSKEFLRQIYSPTAWAQAVIEAKKMIPYGPWQDLVSKSWDLCPAHLPTSTVELVSMLYGTLSDLIAQQVQYPEHDFSSQAQIKLAAIKELMDLALAKARQ